METQTVGILNIIKTKMSALLSQKNYPCVAALKSFNSQDFEINTYQGFGSTESSFKLADDLMKYAKNYEKTKSAFFTFWAVYPDTSEMSEESFEDKLWKELSALASHQEFSSKSPF